MVVGSVFSSKSGESDEESSKVAGLVEDGLCLLVSF